MLDTVRLLLDTIVAARRNALIQHINIHATIRQVQQYQWLLLYYNTIEYNDKQSCIQGTENIQNSLNKIKKTQLCVPQASPIVPVAAIVL